MTKFEISSIIDNTLLSNQSFISEIFYTDTNPFVIETTDVKKVDSRITKVTNKQTYNLKCFNSDLSQVTKNVKDEIMSVVKSTQQTSSIDYYSKGFFKFIKKNDINLLLNKISQCGWVILSRKTYKQLSKIKLDVQFFIEDVPDNEIFFGNSDSVGLIINNNYKIQDSTIEFELLIYNKSIRKIILE